MRPSHRVRCVAEVLQRIAARMEEVEMDLDDRRREGEVLAECQLDTIAYSVSKNLANAGWGEVGCANVRYDPRSKRHEVSVDIATVCAHLAVNQYLQWTPT